MNGNMIPTERDLLPGVTLAAIPTKRFKVGHLSVTFPMSPAPALAPARSLMLSVLRRGNIVYPTLADFNRRLDELYATPFRMRNAVRGGRHCLGCSADLLGRSFMPDKTDLPGEILFLMEQMLLHPLTEESGELTTRYVQAERKNAIDAVRSIRNHPAAYAMTKFCEQFYRGELQGGLLCGNEEQIRALKQEQLTEQWYSMLRTAPIRCFYIGDSDIDRIGEQIRTLVSAVPGRAVLQDKIDLHPSAVQPSVERYESELDAGQSHLILGFRTGVTVTSSEFYAMMLCHEILGLSPISKLFVHVREEHGVCYSCASEYHIDRGDIVISCGISQENRDRAEAAILDQIKALAAGDITDAEWQAARKSLENSYRQLEDSPRAIASFYELRGMLGLGQTAEDCRRAFAAVTRDQVVAVAARIRLQTVYFGCGVGRGEEELDDEV